jgi:hypothetical protein
VNCLTEWLAPILFGIAVVVIRIADAWIHPKPFIWRGWQMFLPTRTTDPDIRNSLEQHLRLRIDLLVKAVVLECADGLNKPR